MRLTYVPLGTPGTLPIMFFHVWPPSRESCRLPSSVPTHSTCAFSGDSAIAVDDGYHCTPSYSESVSRLGFTPRIGRSLRFTPEVRSPPKRVHVSPRSIDLNR